MIQTTRKYPRRMPTSCTVRLKPKPPSRTFGEPGVRCSFSGGPFAGHEVRVRHFPLLPLKLAGGTYTPTSQNTLTWSKA